MKRTHLVELTREGILAGSAVDAARMPQCTRHALDHLVADLARSDQLSAFGTYLAGQEIIRALQNAVELPKLADIPPRHGCTIVIGGLPRTGTTLLQSLLACDT